MLVIKEDNHKIIKNDRGFTLIELLISIAILALIVIPILNSFLLSSNLNAKAKQKHKATMVAENIMEKLKSNDLEDIEKWTDITQNLSSSDVREYRLESYTDQGRQYNVHIKMDPTSALYKYGSEKMLINDYSFPVIGEVYGNSNAIISQNKEDEVAAQTFYEYNQAAFKDNPSIGELGVDEIKQIMKKNMCILILPSTKTNHFIVESYFIYTCESPKLLEADQMLELVVYSKDIENLNSIYLFYDPLELNYTDTIHQDNLFINNKAKAVANVYIVNRGETFASANYLLDATFRMKDGKQVRGIVDYRKNGKSCLTFYSNLKQPFLGTVNMNVDMGTNTLAPKSGEKENRIYDVTVTVYKKGDWSNPLVEFSTTKEEW